MAAQQLHLNSVDATNVQAGAAKKSFTFHGVVESVDSKAGRVTVNNEKIEGWMDAMTMAYSVDKPADLEKVKPGDRIEATVYQDDYKLYNINVIGHK
jgi:Cu/Ag efflux protein CusF